MEVGFTHALGKSVSKGKPCKQGTCQCRMALSILLKDTWNSERGGPCLESPFATTVWCIWVFFNRIFFPLWKQNCYFRSLHQLILSEQVLSALPLKYIWNKSLLVTFHLHWITEIISKWVFLLPLFLVCNPDRCQSIYSPHKSHSNLLRDENWTMLLMIKPSNSFSSHVE